MKKFYTIIGILFMALVSVHAQLPGYFEITVVDDPGATNNRAIVKMRPILSVIPITSTCNGDDAATQVISGLTFGIKWLLSSDITGVTQLNTGNAEPFCGDLPDPAALYDIRGSGTPFSDATRSVRAFLANSAPSPVPYPWVLNQWVTICTLNITRVVPCVVCEDLDIYVPGEWPAAEAAIFIIPVFRFNQTGAIGQAIDYLAAPINAPLPLNLLSFKAEKSGTRDALLTWTTANEDNTSHFQIQRSFDKKTWYDAGSISAAGFSIEIKNYNFLDYQVYNGLDRRFTVYYRLNMVDLDGKKTLSPIKSVIYGADANKGREFVIYPNPATDGLQVEWDAQRDVQPTSLEFFDIQGKLVYSQVVSDHTNQEYIDFSKSTIQPGLYLLRILNGSDPLDYKQVVVGQR